ncbi:MAG: hypothetical protein GX934_09270 [Burkholderiales bacterium]|jgi:hypothetical protein|nr:hypothetical protein [Burkholderiales bacterium]
MAALRILHTSDWHLGHVLQANVKGIAGAPQPGFLGLPLRIGSARSQARLAG